MIDRDLFRAEQVNLGLSVWPLALQAIGKGPAIVSDQDGILYSILRILQVASIGDLTHPLSSLVRAQEADEQLQLCLIQLVEDF